MSQSSALLLLEDETASIENRQAEPSDTLDQRGGPGGRYRADEEIRGSRLDLYYAFLGTQSFTGDAKLHV